MDEHSTVHHDSIKPGEVVYTNTARPIGRISSLSEAGFEVEILDTGKSEMEEIPGQEFGKGFLMWRCTECGKMDELDNSFPDSCPDCGAPREAITVVEED